MDSTLGKVKAWLNFQQSKKYLNAMQEEDFRLILTMKPDPKHNPNSNIDARMLRKKVKTAKLGLREEETKRTEVMFLNFEF